MYVYVVAKGEKGLCAPRFGLDFNYLFVNGKTKKSQLVLLQVSFLPQPNLISKMLCRSQCQWIVFLLCFFPVVSIKCKSSIFFCHCRALHIAVVQGKQDFVLRMIQLLLSARRSPDIYNNLRQVKQIHFEYICYRCTDCYPMSKVDNKCALLTLCQMSFLFERTCSILILYRLLGDGI